MHYGSRLLPASSSSGSRVPLIPLLQAAVCGFERFNVYQGAQIFNGQAHQQQTLLASAASTNLATQLAASLASIEKAYSLEPSRGQRPNIANHQTAATTSMSLHNTFQARCVYPNAASLQKVQQPPVLQSLGFTSSLPRFPLTSTRPRDFRFDLSTAAPCRASSSSNNGVPPVASSPRETAASAASPAASVMPDGAAAVPPKHHGNGRLAVDTNGNAHCAVTHEDLLRRWAALPQPIGPESSASPIGEVIPGGGADGMSGEVSDGETSDGSPGPLWGSVVWASAIDVRRQIFCNRSLNMKSIQAVGFDMDYTLAQYRPDTFETLAYNETIKKLVHSLGYPSELLQWTFDWRYMVRGLVLDKKRGNILKMDRHKYVKVAYHGFRQLSKEERKALYSTTPARESFDEPDFALIDTLFSLAEAYLFAQLVDFHDAFPGRLPTDSYAEMYRAVRAAVDLCHRDGSLKNAVAWDPAKYITFDGEIVPMLKMLRDSGRSTFLVTNSLWDYTHVVMNFLNGKEGEQHGTPRDLEWLNLFDLVIVGSGKPGFFLESSRLIFEVDVHTGMLSNTDNGSPMPQVGDLPTTLHVSSPSLGQGCKVFQGGGVQHLHKMLNVSAGSNVLYVGDHIYGDILRSKKSLGWRTMLVVPELVREIHMLRETAHLRKRFHQLRSSLDAVDERLQQLRWSMRFQSLNDEQRALAGAEKRSMQAEREAIRVMYRETMAQWHGTFHPVWGQLMKTGFQNSRFAHQVERFACLYTSHVTNLGHYSPDRNYHTVEDFMPHEFDILDVLD